MRLFFGTSSMTLSLSSSVFSCLEPQGGVDMFSCSDGVPWLPSDPLASGSARAAAAELVLGLTTLSYIHKQKIQIVK